MISTVTSYVPTWYLFVEMFYDLKKQRNIVENTGQATNFKVASLNASLIVHLTAIIEGAIIGFTPLLVFKPKQFSTISLHTNKFFSLSSLPAILQAMSRPAVSRNKMITEAGFAVNRTKKSLYPVIVICLLQINSSSHQRLSLALFAGKGR
jgi:hypothetical protein